MLLSNACIIHTYFYIIGQLSYIGDTRKGLNSLIILGAWTIWRLRNDCVFNGAAPSIPVALARAREEAHLWSLAGAKGLPLHTTSAVP